MSVKMEKTLESVQSLFDIREIDLPEFDKKLKFMQKRTQDAIKMVA